MQAQVVPIQSTEDLIREGASLKSRIERDRERLQSINQQLAQMAEFKDGKKTGHLIGAGFKVKVQLRENEKWDQGKLSQVREVMGPAFFDIFAAEYKPRSSKDLNGFLKHGPIDFRQGIELAREVKQGAPQVTFEALED